MGSHYLARCLVGWDYVGYWYLPCLLEFVVPVLLPVVPTLPRR